MKSRIQFDQPIIFNDFVTCYLDRMVIHFYYFPYGDKIIKYKDIRSCDLLPLRDLSRMKYKIWGMALSSIWWHSDLRRYYRENYIIIDTNCWPKIGITMDDKDITDVYELIKQEMNASQSTKTSSKKKKVDTNMNSSMSKKEIEYRNSFEDVEEKYMEWSSHTK